MNQINEIKAKFEKALKQKNCFTDLLGKAEEKTGVERAYLAAGFIAFNALYLLVGYGSQFLANFIGFIYPAYCSVKAIESVDKADDTKWLTYWVVYAAFSLLEYFTDIFLFWIPCYSFLKCIFLIYCFFPAEWNGSVLIYNRIIKPIVLKHQAKIDKIGGDVANFAEDASKAAEFQYNSLKSD